MRLSKIFTVVTLVLFVLACLPLAWIVNGEWAVYRAADEGLASIQIAHLAMVAVEKISFERGPANVLIGSPADQDARERLRRAGRPATARCRIWSRPVALELRLPPAGAGRGALRPAALERGAPGHGPGHRLAEARLGRDHAIYPADVRRGARHSRGGDRPLLAGIEHLPPVVPSAERRPHGDRTARIRRPTGLDADAALAEQRPLAESETRDIHILRGRIEQLRGTILQRLNAPSLQPGPRQAVGDMESLYFREGLAQVDDILLDSHLGRPYRVSLAEFTAGYVPTLYSIVELRDAMLTAAAEEAASSGAPPSATCWAPSRWAWSR
ncbi:Uncharacterised protein [Chromobacterium violaceum]|uniref:Uncharacterized protein n=1 Tax=Chromobacterium violaceum TaxID=536 RepID=A0A3S4I9X6_CHRVL|nr:Uncharacterised protein [Chromobacterium violaceum]